MNRYEQNFKAMQRLGIIDAKGMPAFEGAIKIENEPYMPLSVDFLISDFDMTNGPNSYTLAIAHNYIQNGDVMADPDMDLRVFPGAGMVEALTFQNSGAGIYQAVYTDDGKYYPRLKELNAFLQTWLVNLNQQGFNVKKAAA